MQTSIVAQTSSVPCIIQCPSDHNHFPDLNLVVRGTAISKMRARVVDAPLQPLSAIYEASVAEKDVPDDVRVLLPTFTSVRPALRRQRAGDRPKLPKCKADINIDGEWAHSFDNEEIILPTDSNKDLLMFTTVSNLRCLSECTTLYIDGTFKTCPALYSQLLTIHGLYKGHVVPLVYSLLSDKTSATYYSVFNHLRNRLSQIGLTLNPEFIVSDFEAGFIEAVRLQFPQAKHLGCHFHFGQAVWRKVQETGLVTAYSESEPISGFVQKCIALAFIPASEVAQVFEDLVGSLATENLVPLQPFINYFRSTWLNGLYQIRLWNKYGVDHRHRTNNAMEGWHSGLKRKLPIHPNIYVFIKFVKTEIACATVTIEKATCGEEPPRRKPRYVELEKRLLRAHSDHLTGVINTDELLNRVKYCVQKCKK
jgi:hypothetical protein